MKKIVAGLLFLCLSSVSFGQCTSHDSWTGQDKAKHLAVGAVIGAAGTLVFKKPEYGFLAGTVAGLGKELYDRKGHGTCSAQDFAVTALGAAAGAYGTAWIVTPRFVGVSVRF